MKNVVAQQIKFDESVLELIKSRRFGLIIVEGQYTGGVQYGYIVDYTDKAISYEFFDRKDGNWKKTAIPAEEVYLGNVSFSIPTDEQLKELIHSDEDEDEDEVAEEVSQVENILNLIEELEQDEVVAILKGIGESIAHRGMGLMIGMGY
ncbi:hypothetical protein QB910_000064 [Dabrowskivirus KKP3916]|uniref:Uncharacterized protein n=1 Tax=Alicyclobacillus phage KKP_3916 TaxID=3040651 RepID=A0AAT9V7Q7_9CAUD|nr:hypothetical protein QB910_000064 [Alicyclobacillus phage KKP 3916]